MVYTGAQILKTDALATIPDPAFSLNLLWDQFIAEGRCFGLVWEGTWCDVGAPDNIQLAEAVLNV